MEIHTTAIVPALGSFTKCKAKPDDAGQAICCFVRAIEGVRVSYHLPGLVGVVSTMSPQRAGVVSSKLS